MAIKRIQRNVKNEAGGYDVVHYETEADLVLTSDGETVESALTSIKSKTVSATLTAAAWAGTAAPFTQTLSIADIKDKNTSGSIGLAQSATKEQRDAAREAMLCITGQGNGFITVTADGVKPTVDIPTSITIFPQSG